MRPVSEQHDLSHVDEATSTIFLVSFSTSWLVGSLQERGQSRSAGDGHMAPRTNYSVPSTRLLRAPPSHSPILETSPSEHLARYHLLHTMASAGPLAGLVSPIALDRRTPTPVLVGITAIAASGTTGSHGTCLQVTKC